MREEPPGSTYQRTAEEKAVDRLAFAFENKLWSNRDIALLRRMDIRRPKTHRFVFWRAAIEILEPEISLGQGDRRRDLAWIAILQGLAVLFELHSPSARLGGALYEAKVNEWRLERFLETEGTTLLNQVRLIAKRLKNSGTPVDWGEMAKFVLSDGTLNKPQNKTRIAQAYVWQQLKQSASDNPEHKSTSLEG